MAGWFDKMFDFDHDGKLNWIESAAKHAFILKTMEGDNKKSRSSGNWNSNVDADEDFACEDEWDDWDSDEDDFDSDDADEWDEEYEDEDEISEEEKLEELESALFISGLCIGNLQLMNEYERREAIEEVGLDPNDYEDLFW